VLFFRRRQLIYHDEPVVFSDVGHVIALNECSNILVVVVDYWRMLSRFERDSSALRRAKTPKIYHCGLRYQHLLSCLI